MAIQIKILLAVLMTGIGSFGALCFKFISKPDEKLTIKRLLFNKMLYLGGFLYVLSSLINVVLLNFWDYSIVYPLTSLTYVWTLFTSHFILKEKINVLKILAITLIIGGIIVINL